MNVLLIGGPKDIDGRIVEARDDYPYIEMYESPPLSKGFLFEEDPEPIVPKIHRYVVEPFIVFDRVTGVKEDVHIGVLDGMSTIEAVYELFWSYNDTKSKEALRQKFSH